MSGATYERKSAIQHGAGSMWRKMVDACFAIVVCDMESA